MKRFINFLKTDIKIINSYFLLLIILIILVCIGYSSYALFSFSKTSTNIIEGTVGKIKKSGADTLIKLTDNKDNSGLYTITHEADSTLQIGTNESVTEYRYRGASPKNYVTFNNEVWRIIGIFPVDDGTGKIESRIKIVRNDSAFSQYWDQDRSNNWTNSWLRSYLNNYLGTNAYLDSIIEKNKLMIGDAKYYLGGYSSTYVTKEDMYKYEKKISGSDYYSGTNPNSWTGKIALMYASDCGYAVSDECTQTLWNYNNSLCKSNSWLYNTQHEWLLNQSTNSLSGAFQYLGSGIINYYNGNNNYSTNTKLYIRPTLYLVSNVQITGGKGTSTDPYTFEL